MLNSRLPVRALASTALVGAMTATGALMAAPVANADTIGAWTAGGHYMCKVTGTGLRKPIYERWEIGALIDEGQTERVIGKIHEARSIETAARPTGSTYLTKLKAKTVKGSMNFTYMLGKVPVTAWNLKIATTPTPLTETKMLLADGMVHAYKIPGPPGEYWTKMGYVSMSLTTNSRAHVSLSCPLTKKQDRAPGAPQFSMIDLGNLLIKRK